MSLYSDTKDIIDFIRTTSTEVAVQKATVELMIKIEALATRNLELHDMVNELRTRISELEDQTASDGSQYLDINAYKKAKIKGISCFISKDADNAETADELYCPACFSKGRLSELAVHDLDILFKVDCTRSDCNYEASKAFV